MLIAFVLGCSCVRRGYIDRYECDTPEQRAKMAEAAVRCGGGWNSDDCRRVVESNICSPHYALMFGDSFGADCGTWLSASDQELCRRAGWRPQ